MVWEEEDSCVSWSGSPGTAAGVSHPRPALVSCYFLHLYPVTAESATVTHSHIATLAHLLCTGLSSFFRPQNKLSHAAETLVWAAHNVTKRWSQRSNWKMIAYCTSDVRIGHFKPVFLLLPLARRANVFTVMHISELCCLCKAGEIWPRAFHFSPFIFHLHSFNHLYSEYRGKYFIMCNLRAPLFGFFNKTTKKLNEKCSSWTETVHSLVVVGFIAQPVFRLE